MMWRDLTSILVASICVTLSMGAIAKDGPSSLEAIEGVYKIGFGSHYYGGSEFHTENILVRRLVEALAIWPNWDDLRREYPELEPEDIR